MNSIFLDFDTSIYKRDEIIKNVNQKYSNINIVNNPNGEKTIIILFNKNQIEKICLNQDIIYISTLSELYDILDFYNKYEYFSLGEW